MASGKNEKADESIRRTVGNNVRAAREHAGLSQRELCDRAQLGQAYLSQCESGKWNIGVDNIARIACATGFLPHHLLNPDFEPESLIKRGAMR
jgi:transcriptional regulator with XRE-family HTH domain